MHIPGAGDLGATAAVRDGRLLPVRSGYEPGHADGLRSGGSSGFDPSLWRQPHRLKSALVDATDDLGAPGADNLFSKGRLNTLRALQ